MFRKTTAMLTGGAALAASVLVLAGAGVSTAQTAQTAQSARATVASTAAASGVAMTTSVTRYPIAPGYRVNVRSGPGTKYSIVRTLPVGATVAIYCQTYGETVSGPYGTSNVWDNIANGEFVSDAYVKTGSDSFVAPRCS